MSKILYFDRTLRKAKEWGLRDYTVYGINNYSDGERVIRNNVLEMLGIHVDSRRLSGERSRDLVEGREEDVRLAEYMRENDPSVPIILFTGSVHAHHAIGDRRFVNGLSAQFNALGYPHDRLFVKKGDAIETVGRLVRMAREMERV